MANAGEIGRPWGIDNRPRPQASELPVKEDWASHGEMTYITTSSTAIEELERRLRSQGRDVRLLGELPLAKDDAALVRDQLLSTIRAYGSAEGVQSYVTEYPWAVARWLVELGNEVYEDGTLWPYVAAELGADYQVPLRQAFEYALKRLDLRSFPGHRYVASILGHGMVPRRHLPDLLATTADVLPHLGSTVNPEQLRRELLQHPMMNLRPVIRFLDQRGVDEIIHYYLEHVAHVVRYGPSSDTPAVFQQAYRQWKAPKRRAPVVHRERATPALEVSFVEDAEDYLPLAVRLPECRTTDDRWPVRVMADGMLADVRRNPPDRTVDGWRHAAVRYGLPAPRTQLSIALKGGARHTFDLSRPVWWFTEDGSWWPEPWLERDRWYYLLAAPGTKLNVETEALGTYGGAWSGYALGRWRATVPRVEATTGSPTVAWPVEEVPTRVAPRGSSVQFDDPDPVVLAYGAFSRAPTADDFQVVIERKDGLDTPVRLLASDLDVQDTTVRLDLTTHLTEWGSYPLRVQGPLNLRDHVRVTHRPPVSVRSPDRLAWPSQHTGAHRAGQVTVWGPAGIELAVAGQPSLAGVDGAPSVSVDVTVDQGHVDVTVGRPGGSPYHERVPFRQVWWEWGVPHEKPVVNRPLVAAWQDVWATPPTLWWDTSDDHTLRLILADHEGHPIPIADEWPRQEAHSILGLLDEMRGRPGPAFVLYGRISREGQAVGQYPLARIVRTGPVELQATVQAGHLVLEGPGEPPGPIKVTLTGWPAWRHAKAAHWPRVTTNSLTPQRHFAGGWQIEWGQQLDEVPYELWAAPQTPQSGAVRAEPVRRLVLPDGRPGKVTREPFQQSILHWLKGGRAPAPTVVADFVMWVRAARWLPLAAVGSAYVEGVAPQVEQTAGQWMEGVLAVDGDVDDSWLRVGLPEWPLGAVSTKEIPRLVSQLSGMTDHHPVWTWLVVSGLQEWKSPAAEAAAGLWGNPYAEAVRAVCAGDGAVPLSVGAVLEMATPQFPEVPLSPDFLGGVRGMGGDGDGGLGRIGGDDARWLSDAVARVMAQAPHLGPYWQRFIGEDGDDWASVRRLAWLQRLSAWDLAPDSELASTASRRIELALSLNRAWRGVYLDVLWAADLVAALAYQTADELDNWDALPRTAVK